MPRGNVHWHSWQSIRYSRTTPCKGRASGNGQQVEPEGPALRTALPLHQRVQLKKERSHRDIHIKSRAKPPDTSVSTRERTMRSIEGYASIKVGSQVSSFDGRGLGIYCFFDHPVQLENAIETPRVGGVTFQHVVTQWFKNAEGSGINHIIDGAGLAVNSSNLGATY